VRTAADAPAPSGPRPADPVAGLSWLERGTLAAVALGIVLRAVWPSEMEYKGDERYVYHHALAATPSWLGQGSSVGIRNPGMSQWWFWLMAHALRHVTGTPSPVALDRCVIAANCLALVGLVMLVWRVIGRDEREPWLWGTAMLALSPVTILFSRKLWEQCLLAPFVVVTLWGWWRRSTRAGAFAWGLVGAWLGQIHLSGLFFAPALLLWTLVRDRRGVRWRWWLAGTVLGLLTVIPWALKVLHGAGTSHKYSLDPGYAYLWLITPLGLPLLRSFGPDTHRFLAWPAAGGSGLGLHLMLVAFGVAIGAAGLIGLGTLVKTARLRSPGEFLRGTGTRRLVVAGLVVYGILLTATGSPIYRHYLIIVFALPFVFLASAGTNLGRWGRALLTAIIVAEAAISVGYLTYINHAGGTRGDYGRAYSTQRRAPVHPRGA
jgi:hypothetical protein